MALRETINRSKPVAVVVAIVLIAGALAYGLVSGGANAPGGPGTAFFSTDDGKTWFRDSFKQIAPFKTSDGKIAVKAHVFSCKDGKVQFVGFLERMNEAAKAEIDGYIARKAMPDSPVLARIQESGIEVKRPGEEKWTPRTGIDQALPAVKCPDGSAENPMPVVP